MQDFDVLYDYTVEFNEIIKQEQVEFCNQVLKELNKNEKDIVWLKIIYNFTFREIAYKMKLPISIASWTYYNAIIKLKEKFNK